MKICFSFVFSYFTLRLPNQFSNNFFLYFKVKITIQYSLTIYVLYLKFFHYHRKDTFPPYCFQLSHCNFLSASTISKIAVRMLNSSFKFFLVLCWEDTRISKNLRKIIRVLRCWKFAIISWTLGWIWYAVLGARKIDLIKSNCFSISSCTPGQWPIVLFKI